MPRRTLSLKREVLAELSDADLQVVGGAANDTKQTLYSCLEFITCAIPFCLIPRTLVCPA
jgi:hypothetical protein